MKTIPALCLLLAAAPLLPAQEPAIQDPAAGEPTIEQLVQKREALLVRIYESIQEKYKLGAASKDEVRTANMELHLLRRNHAKTLPERLQWQDRIIQLEKDRRDFITAKVKDGTLTVTEGLRAAERVLAAEQKLLELKAAG